MVSQHSRMSLDALIYTALGSNVETLKWRFFGEFCERRILQGPIPVAGTGLAKKHAGPPTEPGMREETNPTAGTVQKITSDFPACSFGRTLRCASVTAPWQGMLLRCASRPAKIPAR